MASETTSEAFPKVVKREMLEHIANRVGEPKPHDNSATENAAGNTKNNLQILSSNEHTFTRIICNLLTCFWRVQEHHFPGRPPEIKYQIIGSRTDRVITLVINYINIVEHFECEAITRGESRILDIRYQFVSLVDSKALAYGCLTIDISCTTPIGSALPYVPLPAGSRRKRTMEIDWSNSIVLDNDRKIVLDLIDDVHNYESLMPIDLCEWLAPIFNTHNPINDDDDDNEPNHHNHKAVNGNGKRNARASARHDDDDSSLSNLEEHLLGYCITFTNVPSFNLSFLNYLKQKYATRWLSATVIFPHKNRPCRLAFALRCENAFIQASVTNTVGACKRLKTIVERDFCDDDSIVTTNGEKK